MSENVNLFLFHLNEILGLILRRVKRKSKDQYTQKGNKFIDWTYVRCEWGRVTRTIYFSWNLNGCHRTFFLYQLYGRKDLGKGVLPTPNSRIHVIKWNFLHPKRLRYECMHYSNCYRESMPPLFRWKKSIFVGVTWTRARSDNTNYTPYGVGFLLSSVVYNRTTAPSCQHNLYSAVTIHILII